MEARLTKLRKKFESDVKYDTLLDAVNFIIDELYGDKAGAVRWIQENSGGGRGSDYDDTGEVGGNVWGLATYCDQLSTWSEIIPAIALILKRQGN